MWSARCSGVLLLSLLPVLASLPARAADVDFDDLPSPSDVAAASIPGVSISTALVLSETDLESLTGIPAVGTFATSGANGLLNTYAPSITFTFTAPVTSFSVDVLSIESEGVTLPVLLEAFDGANPFASVSSDPGLIGDSGYHEDTLAVFGLFTSVRISVDSSATSTFWLDSASFTAVPEPGTLALAGTGLALLSGIARGRGRRA